jgi:hypothetical protein
MTVRYHTRGGVEVPEHQCVRKSIDTAATRCLLIPGTRVDTAIG